MSTIQKNRAFKKIAAVGVLAVGVTLAAPAGAAMADYSTQVSAGQFVGKDGLHCGGQEIKGVSGPGGSVQHAWVYYNCGDSTVYRKADVNNSWDGDCWGIGPGSVRVLETTYSWFESVYNGTKDC